jgi:transcriptional regulator with XRE-family HTH domain
MVRSRETSQPGLALFAAELAAARSKAGWTMEELAGRINYSTSLIGMIESQRRVPRLDFAERCDTAFGTPGTFARLQQHARTTPLPSWFQPYAEIEKTATQLRSWQPSFVEGLLQTEAYARSVISGRPNTSSEEVDELVAARMARQSILDRDNAPLLWSVLDEGALHRRVVDEKVMSDQLLHLAQLSERPNINVQVVPYSAGAHYGLSGAFAIADVDDTIRLAYLETVTEGYILESPAAVTDVMLIFDTVRAEALSRAASLDLVRKRAQEIWT